MALRKERGKRLGRERGERGEKRKKEGQREDRAPAGKNLRWVKDRLKLTCLPNKLLVPMQVRLKAETFENCHGWLVHGPSSV